MIDKNFFTYKILERKKENILFDFPELNACKHDNFYSLSEYIYDSPSKFYNREIFEITENFLNDLFLDKKSAISFFKILNDFSFEFDHAIKTLTLINSKDIHEVLLPDNDAELMYFISEKIIYEYLKLNDVILLGLLKPIAYYIRLNNNKGTEKLDIYNCIETLKSNKDFEILTEKYNNTLRNAIAHGGVTFESSKIKFKDKKDIQEYHSSNYIKKFDELVDCVNAIVFAYKKILFQYLDELEKYKISIPSSVMEIELRFKANHYAWEILHSYDNIISNGNQYNILIKTNLNSRKFMNFSAAYTAITLEKLLPNKYNNVFFQIKTKYSMPCWQSISLEKLREHYKGKNVTITDGAMFFDEKFFGVRRDHLRIIKSFFFQNLPEKGSKFKLRYIKHHSKKDYNVIENASIFIDAELIEENTIEDFVRKNTDRIISHVKSQKRKNYSSNFKERILPNKYLRIFIYNRDFRKRTFYSGIRNEDFIGMLYVNNTRTINEIIPIFGVQEQKKSCWIIWNKKTDEIYNKIKL
ncbi:hypothetical protein [Flavobacterium sp. 102]|uniref:hypothetical protein n=1 Tax=Flavobacterium sp. 102 TaxID=2135623 RepID=UPI000EAFB35A|nr:hypothetical protein [Flavobacterium sp. 102]RKS01458.1 hypothetical protein C8C84_1118 [Flavobacterium sp. 102]